MSAKYTIKEAVQATKELNFGKDTCNFNQYIKKRMQNNNTSEIITMKGKIFHLLCITCFEILISHLLL